MSIRAFLTALLLLVAVPAWAQFDAGTVLGTVRDSSGGVLPGVTVTLRSVDTGICGRVDRGVLACVRCAAVSRRRHRHRTAARDKQYAKPKNMCAIPSK